MTARTSHLSASELATLDITHFIFHVIEPGASDPVQLLDEAIDLSPRQRQFFLDRLREAARGTQYAFDDRSEMRELCETLVARPNVAFVETSQAIAGLFAKYHHDRRMLPGVVVLALARIAVSANAHRRLLFVLKIDHRPVLQYRLSSSAGRRTARIAEVTNALVESKTAIQKSALIDVSDRFEWDILAAERYESGPELTDYFRRFLSAHVREQPSELTRRAIATVRKWARQLDADDKPESEDAAAYAERAMRYLGHTAVFDTEEFVAAVVTDSDRQRRAAARASLEEALAAVGVAGQHFEPQPGSVAAGVRRTVLRTLEGVQIAYEGPREDVGLAVVDDPDHQGRKRILISTAGIRDVSAS